MTLTESNDSKKKIKLLFDAVNLTHFYEMNCTRSGIYFSAFNILKELSKNDSFEIFLFSDYCELFLIKKFLKHYPQIKAKIAGKITLWNMLISNIMYYKYVYRKVSGKDNFLKKIVRFLTTKTLNLLWPKIHNSFDYINPDDYDAIFSPLYAPAQIIANSKKIKKFLFIHDTIPISQEADYIKLHGGNDWFKRVLSYISKADLCFANSYYTKQDFLKYLPELDSNKILVTYLGADENFKLIKDAAFIDAVKEKYGIDKTKRYIFSLCNLEPRKNLLYAMRNFSEFVKKHSINDLLFVAGGMHWNCADKKLIDAFNKICEANEILRIGYVQDIDLAILYSGSEMFVFPSLYEGFGMPVLEAMQCGCPIIASNLTSVPEVAGKAGILINPESDKDIQCAFEKMYFDSDFKNDCSKKSLLQAKKFSWRKCTNIICDAIIAKF